MPTLNNNPLLQAENICQSYGNQEILKNVNLIVQENEIVALLGVSGGGKTTLFNILAGLNEPTAGTVKVAGEDTTGKPGRVAYMLQKDLLLPHLKVIDNIALPLLIKGNTKKEARGKVEPYLSWFGLDRVAYAWPHALSGGMAQRAALLRTYMAEKPLMLLDEPFSALDALTKNKMHQWFVETALKLHWSGLFITHDIDEAIKLADRIYILGGRPGRIIYSHTIEEAKPRTEDFMYSQNYLQLKQALQHTLQSLQ